MEGAASQCVHVGARVRILGHELTGQADSHVVMEWPQTRGGADCMHATNPTTAEVFSRPAYEGMQ